jgi:Lrp/AsnC family leucine-responsive transcriptional regulator
MDLALSSASAGAAGLPALDAIDRCLVEALQHHGRMTFDELAGRVQLSASAVLRRVRRLEEGGVIVGYAAVVPPERLGLMLTAFVDLQLEPGAQAAQRLATAVQAWPQVVECARLGCDPNRYLLKVVSTDLAQHGRFVAEQLLTLAGVRHCHARFVLDQLKTARTVAG